MRKNRIEKLRAIIETCHRILEGRIDPLEISVPDLIASLDRIYPKLKDIVEIELDSEAIKEISSVLEHQATFIERHSRIGELFAQIILDKIKSLSTVKLVEIFRKCWKPILYVEQIGEGDIHRAVEYWRTVTPYSLKIGVQEGAVEEAREKLKVERFIEKVEKLWMELSLKGPVPYEDFIAGKDRAERFERAYIVSYLLTYGYARVKVENETLILEALERRKLPVNGFTLPIVLR